MTVWIERTAWTSTPPGGAAIRQAARLFVHHTAGPAVSGRAALELCEVYRRQHTVSNGWADIGYSFLVTQAGEVIGGRGWGRSGAHTEGYNSSSYGVAWMGDSTSLAPTGAALEAIADLARTGIAQGWLTADVTVSGHRDVNATACPGSLLYAELGRIRDLIDAPSGDDDMTPEQDARLARIEAWMAASTMGNPVKLPDGATVSQLYANIFEVTVGLRDWAPAVRAEVAALRAELATLRVAVDQFARRPVEVVVHVVQPGETMRDVAERVGAPLAEVMRQARDAGGWRAGLEISSSG